MNWNNILTHLEHYEKKTMTTSQIMDHAKKTMSWDEYDKLLSLIIQSNMARISEINEEIEQIKKFDHDKEDYTCPISQNLQISKIDIKY